MVSSVCRAWHDHDDRDHLLRYFGPLASLLYNALPAPFRKGCNLLALLVGLVAFGPLSAFAYEEFTLALVNGDFIYGKLQLPEWPAAGAFFVGLLVMNLRLLLLFARDMMTVGPYDAAGKGGG